MVQDIKLLEYSLLDLLIHNSKVLDEESPCDRHHEAITDLGPKLKHLRLIVKDFALNFCAHLCAELSPADTVPHCNFTPSQQARTCRGN